MINNIYKYQLLCKNKFSRRNFTLAMDGRRHKFSFANMTFISPLCDTFDDEVPKSYLPDNMKPEINLNFMPAQIPPHTIYFQENGTNHNVVCGVLFHLLKAFSIKMRAK